VKTQLTLVNGLVILSAVMKEIKIILAQAAKLVLLMNQTQMLVMILTLGLHPNVVIVVWLILKDVLMMILKTVVLLLNAMLLKFVMNLLKLTLGFHPNVVKVVWTMFKDVLMMILNYAVLLMYAMLLKFVKIQLLLIP